ncbi:hypothetical protein J2785_007355 [Burkholderia ambifaria]|nr:hypothetical protein [Burkholderia ambifaria]MDR6504159.1 hypothetical protein [Burkholderia ambifaria]
MTDYPNLGGEIDSFVAHDAKVVGKTKSSRAIGWMIVAILPWDFMAGYKKILLCYDGTIEGGEALPSACRTS